MTGKFYGPQNPKGTMTGKFYGGQTGDRATVANSKSTQQEQTANENLLAKAIHKTLPCVVEISCQFDYLRTSHGSGFIVGDKGLIITCCHVVGESVKDPIVTFEDGRRLVATIELKDEASDVAVLQINDVGDYRFQTLKFGMNRAWYGADVFTIGHPDCLNFSISKGIISYPARKIEDIENFYVSQLDTFIQTNVVVFVGNSGGPLMNIKGDLLGVVGSGHKNGGIVFCYPLDFVLKIITRMIKLNPPEASLLSAFYDHPELRTTWPRRIERLPPSLGF
ncbi:hypothetical protein ACFE04_004346 [Oxalis oulophora]